MQFGNFEPKNLVGPLKNSGIVSFYQALSSPIKIKISYENCQDTKNQSKQASLWSENHSFTLFWLIHYYLQFYEPQLLILAVITHPVTAQKSCFAKWSPPRNIPVVDVITTPSCHETLAGFWSHSPPSFHLIYCRQASNILWGLYLGPYLSLG